MMRVEHAGTLAPRVFRGEIDRSWGIASFSRLINGRETDASDEGPVLDNPAPAEQPVPLQGIHAFPRGMRAGTCLHEILEEVDFREPAAAPELVSRKLRAYGIEGFDEPVLANVRQLAKLPLPADHFTLADVDPLARIPELEFTFPINAFTIAKLAAVFGDEIPLRIDRLQFSAISGFMTGFIDLIFEHGERFYFIDWKSNWLGPNLSAYGPAAVQSEMQRHYYTLQLCLYTVALHRYLRVRKPGYDYDQHFGGAFYIFLRGIDPACPQSGVHHQRLDHGFVEKLSAIFER
jgi:exodeoxyribonuclease V beta subunit